MALVYNFVRKNGLAPQAPPIIGPEAEQPAEATGPVMLVVPLVHHQTLAELSFADSNKPGCGGGRLRPAPTRTSQHRHNVLKGSLVEPSKLDHG